MGKVIFNMSMSLDGFIAGPNDEVDRLVRWYFSGDTVVAFPGSDMVFKVSQASAELFENMWPAIGAMVTGRRNFDGARGWGGKPPLGVPHVVVSHSVPSEWVGESSPFTFVTDGVASAVTEAKKIAGDKHVVISSPNVMQQCLTAGLLDELYIDLVPVLLGEGIRLFEHMGAVPRELERVGVIAGSGVTHLSFGVVK